MRLLAAITLAASCSVSCSRLPEVVSSTLETEQPLATVDAGSKLGPLTPPRVGQPPKHGYADIATAPLQIWAGVAEDGVIERVIIAGHADLPCCSLISSVLHDAITQGKVSGSSAHGFSDTHLNDTPESIFALQEVVSVAQESRRAEAECAEYVSIHRFSPK